MPNRDYHVLQAGLLVRLADTTSDSTSALHLRAMAAEHIALAEQYVSSSMIVRRLRAAPNGKPDSGDVLG